jgi:hypothetical protein
MDKWILLAGLIIACCLIMGIIRAGALEVEAALLYGAIASLMSLVLANSELK